MIKLKDLFLKNENHLRYKKLQKHFINFTEKLRTQLYFINYFQENLNDLDISCEGIKKLSSLKQSLGYFVTVAVDIQY